MNLLLRNKNGSIFMQVLAWRVPSQQIITKVEISNLVSLLSYLSLLSLLSPVLKCLTISETCPLRGLLLLKCI